MGNSTCKKPQIDKRLHEIQILDKRNGEKNLRKKSNLVNKISVFKHHVNFEKYENSFVSIVANPNNQFLNSYTANNQFLNSEAQLVNKIIQFSYSEIKETKKLRNKNKLIRFDPSRFVLEQKGDFFKFYELLNLIGKSTYGDIYKAKCKFNNEYYSVKFLSKNACKADKNLLSEIEILKTLDHPNILKIIEYFQDANNIYIITEFYKGSELSSFQKINGIFSEKETAVMMAQILSAVFYCHNQNVIHRDIRPENIIIEENDNNNNLKIIDFGTSKLFKPNEEFRDKIKYTPYVAPEALKSECYDSQCDIWSCGILMYFLLTGHTPFDGYSKEQIDQKLSLGLIPYSNPIFDQLSRDGLKLLKSLLCIDPKERCCAQKALDDIWIVKFTHKLEFEAKGLTDSLSHLHQFNSKINFQRAVLSLIAKRLTSKDNENKLREIFKMIDVNNDGQLSKEELLEGYKMLTGDENLAKEQVDQIMENIDVNQNGTIDYNEFLMANIDIELLESESKLKEAFRFFDQDGSGDICIEELKRIFVDTEEAEIIDEILNDIDSDGNGKISFEEFKEVIKKFIDESKLKPNE